MYQKLLLHGDRACHTQVELTCVSSLGEYVRILMKHAHEYVISGRGELDFECEKKKWSLLKIYEERLPCVRDFRKAFFCFEGQP